MIKMGAKLKKEQNKKLTVVKHNSIVEGNYQLTVYESRILLTCIAKVDSKKKLTDHHVFSITVNDIAELVNIDRNAAYTRLKQSVDSLLNRFITIDVDGGLPLKTRWVYGVRYAENEGKIELRFAPEIMPLLSNLKGNFTQYKLTHVLGFQSSYSIRLYEILCEKMGGECILEVDWIKKKFEIDNEYSRVGNLKARVIDPAVNEINTYSNMRVSYTQVKRGRTIVGFKFVYVIAIDKKSSKPQQKFSEFLNEEKIKPEKHINSSTSKKNINNIDDIDNIEYFADMRKKYGDAVTNAIPDHIIELLKFQGRW